MHVQPPLESTESPDGTPRWPTWYSITAFGAALLTTLIAVGVLAGATGTGADEESAAFTVAATLVEDAIFVGTALLFASGIAPPRPADFGLRRAAFWSAAGWAALGMLCFYAFTAVYSALVQNQPDQDVVQKLGANEGTLGLIVAGMMVIVVAPSAEEFFFRGFFYKGLRTGLPVAAAALTNGALFGLIHWDPGQGLHGLLILPPLAVLGAVFCLVYERTGTLYPVIGLHSLNNALAYGVQAHAWEVSAVLGPLMLVAVALVPRLAHPRAPAAAPR